MNKNLPILFLGFLFIFGFTLRFYSLPQNLFIGPEQGRDLLVVRDIVINHKLVLIGSKTDIDGIFHGPLFYYLCTIPFVITGGNPLFIGTFLVFLHSLTVFLVFLIGKDFFGKRVGYIAASLYTVSFGAIVYSRWLSNPPLSIPLSILFFYFTFQYLKGKRNSLILACLALGLAFQVEFINGIFLAGIALTLLVTYQKKFLKERIRILLLSLVLLIASAFGTYILFDVRHEFLITKSIIGLVNNSSHYFSFLDTARISVLMIVSFTQRFILPLPFLSGILLIVLFTLLVQKVLTEKNDAIFLVFLWLVIPFFVLVLLRHDVIEHFFSFIAVALILSTSLLIEMIWKKNHVIGITTLLVVILLNLFAWINHIPQNSDIYFQTTQAGLTYADEKKTISWIYSQAKGNPFFFQAYTIPYWSQQGWEYLFWYYGKQYGSYPTQDAKTLFVIIQNDPSNEKFQQNWLNNTVSHWGIKESQFRSGALTVEQLAVK